MLQLYQIVSNCSELFPGLFSLFPVAINFVLFFPFHLKVGIISYFNLQCFRHSVCRINDEVMMIYDVCILPLSDCF